MYLQDFIALLLSGCALLVSLVSLYFSTFYKSSSLIGTLVAWNPRAEFIDNHQICEISLSNTGNTELLLREIDILSFPELKSELVPILESTQIPNIIKPGEIKLFTLPIPDLYLTKIAENNATLRLSFHIFTTDGQLTNTSKDLVPNISNAVIPDSDWKPFKLI